MPNTNRFSELAAELLPFSRERLASYVSQESPTGDAEALDGLAEVLGANFAELGCRVERQSADTGDHLVVTANSTGDSGRHLLFLGHHDTVWPRGQLDGAMPYSDDGEVIRGPGVFDMKAGLVIFETALRLLAETESTPTAPARLIVVADEEIGSPTGKAVVETHLPDAAAVFGLEPPHPRGGLKTGRHGSTRARLRVSGVEAHAALDRTRGVSAIDELVDQLVWLRALTEAEPDVLFNVGTVCGGSRTNVTAGEATAELGLRFGDGDSERRVLDALLDAEPTREGAGVSTELLSNRPAWAPSTDGWLLDHVRAAGTRVGQDVRGSAALGAADTNIAGATGVPTLDGLGAIGSGAHALHEQIRVASLAERTALVAALLTQPLPN